ncbi:MAG: YsnF/AvaK domain-containing protein [Actinobacteria bacterium]|nr:YsnF/AvaK domain-containing protein [Actinomycetota bacterium]
MTRVTEESHRWQRLVLVDRAGARVGKIKDVYLDRHSQRPEWALVSTGLLPTTAAFVPLAGAVIADETITVPFAKAQITTAPRIDPDGELSPGQEASLYDHYGVDHSARPAPEPEIPSGATVVGPRGHPSEDDAMTRSEEEVTFDRVRRPAEVVRLKKYVVTEDVQVNVTVRREEVRLERMPVTDADKETVELAEDEWGEGSAELVLFEEQVVVGKKVVPRERVRLEKDVVTQERTVTTDVRKERIDFDRENLP